MNPFMYQYWHRNGLLSPLSPSQHKLKPTLNGCVIIQPNWVLVFSTFSLQRSGLEQAVRVSVSAGGSSYLQPSAGPGNNTCIRLPQASHLTNLPHYNYEPCNPAGELSPAGNSCPGGPAGSSSWGEGERHALLSRKKALGLDIKMLDPSLPGECSVSIIQRCSVTALYLCPSSLSHHYLISDHRQTRSLTESLSIRNPWGMLASSILRICI